MGGTIINLILEVKKMGLKGNFLHRSFIGYQVGKYTYFLFYGLPDGAEQGLRPGVGEGAE